MILIWEPSVDESSFASEHVPRSSSSRVGVYDNAWSSDED